MFSTKIRTALALFAAVFAVALATGPLTPTDAQAQIKSNPTGNSDLDAICQRIANLINYANSQGDLAMIDGDDEASQAWYDLADDMIRRGTKAGCKLVAGSYREPAAPGDPQVSDGGGAQLPDGRPQVDDGALADGMPAASDGMEPSAGGPQLTYSVPTKALAASGKDRPAVKAAAKRLARRARAA
jgi:hypothetical protein